AVPTKEQQAQLLERDRLQEEAFEYQAEGHLEHAVAAWQQVLRIERAVLGDLHEDVAGSLWNLAELYAYLGDSQRARARGHEVARLSQLAGRPWRRTDAEALQAFVERLAKMPAAQRQQLEEAARSFRMANHLYGRQRYREALPHCRRAVDLRKQVLGEKTREYAAALSMLGLLHLRLEKYAEAEPLLRRSLEIRKMVAGEENPVTITSLYNLGALYGRKKDYAQAEPFRRQALELRKRVLGEEHADYASSLNALAILYEN